MKDRTRRNAPFRIFLFACLAVVLSFAVLGMTSCSSQPSEAEVQVQKNRSYMSQVNQLASTMSEKLNAFADAFADENIVSMRQLVDEVGTTIADLEKLEAPSDALKAVHEDYVAGVAKLKDALTDHLNLYIASVADRATEAADGSTENAGVTDASKTGTEGSSSDENNSDTAGSNTGTTSKNGGKEKTSESPQYESEIKSIQKLYDEGMKLLEEADKKAAEIK